MTRVQWLLFRVLLVVCGTASALAATASGAGLKERIESAAVETTFDAEGAQARAIRVEGDLVSFVLGKEDSSVAIVFDLTGRRRFRLAIKDSDTRQIQGVALSQDGSTVLVREFIGSESYNVRIFSIAGREKFHFHTSSGFIISPSGKRFCTLASEVEPQALDLYDATGERIRQLLSAIETWSCSFVDDDHLLVADGMDTLRLFDARSGTVLWIRSLEFKSDLISHTPLIELSPTQPFIALYDSHHVTCLSDTYQELWRREYAGILTAVIIDDYSPTALLEFYDVEERCGYALKVSLADGEPLSSPVRLSRSQKLSYGGARSASFSHGLLMSPGPTVSTPGSAGPEFKPWTMFLRLDDEAGPSPKPVVVSGTYVAAPSTKERLNMIRMSDSGSAELISVRKHD